MIYQAELEGQKSQPMFNQRIMLKRAKLLENMGKKGVTLNDKVII